MSTRVMIPVLGKRIRVTALDACGNVPAGTTPGTVVATDGFISVGLSAQVDDGQEIITKKADGSLCVNEKLSSNFKRFNVDIDFCGVNPSLVAMVSNAKPYLDYNLDVAGFTIGQGSINKRFALELWTGLSGAACVVGGSAEASGYLLLPFIVAGTIGDISIDGEKAATFSLSGAHTRGGNVWGVGPYNVVMNATQIAAGLPTPLDPFDHLLMMDTNVAPPPSSAEPTTVVPGPSTGATAGAPGAFTPAGSVKPATFTQANTNAVVASPATAWTTGQYCQGTTAGAPGEMNWTGTTWATGRHA